MRVAIFTNNYFPRLSGVSVAVNFLDSALKMAGHETLIVAPNYGFGHKVKGVNVFRVKSLYLRPMRMSLPFQWVDQGAIREAVEHYKPDIIHSHHPFLIGRTAVDIADDFDVPLVYTFHTLYEFFTHYFMADTDAVKKRVREYVVNYTNLCDLVVAPTEPIRQYLVDIGVETRSESVPTGIDFSRFRNATGEMVAEVRDDYCLERFDHVLLSVGRISKEKNVGVCVKALAELVKRGMNAGLVFFGDGPEMGDLEADAERLGIGDRVIMGGFLDQNKLAAAYFVGDVFLFPSESDTQGIVLYEAQAAGLPVVAADSMASRAAVRDGKNGLFAKVEPLDFAAKIEEVLKNRDKYSEAFDMRAFSREHLGGVYDRLYRETIEKGRRKKPKDSLASIFDELKGLVKG